MYDILIIGTTSGDFGGTNVSLYHMLNFLKHKKIRFYHLETGGIRNRNFLRSFIMFFKLTYKLYKYSKKSNIISAHLNYSAVPILGPFIYVISKMQKKNYSIRIFGGFGYRNKNFIKNKISFFVVKKSFMYFAQTKGLYNEAKLNNVNVEWFPTVRPNSEKKINSNTCKKLVYVGRIIKEKGILLILEASSKINHDISIDFYGPIQGGLSSKIFDGYDNIKYRGIIEPKNIYQTLIRYDLMLFPTFYAGEGYPGIILEALNVGMPIITTNWLDISDIVNDNCALIIEPKKSDKLSKAINKICQNDELYLNLCHGAQKQSEIFNLELLYNNFVKIHGVRSNWK